MRIISRKRYRDFWEGRRHDGAIARRDFTAWERIAAAADWPNFAALRQTFGSADAVGNCVVFDVGNNRFRLIGRVNYRVGIIYILAAMDHEEYDRDDWPKACGCHEPPPRPDGSSPRTDRPDPRRRRR